MKVFQFNFEPLNIQLQLLQIGMKVILDFIPNHTSKEHEWFLKSVKQEGKYKDYYVWKNGTQWNPPNGWVRLFLNFRAKNQFLDNFKFLLSSNMNFSAKKTIKNEVHLVIRNVLTKYVFALRNMYLQLNLRLRRLIAMRDRVNHIKNMLINMCSV